MEKEPIKFQGFDEHRDVRIYEHGVLPHWRQDGCAYFVTFRLDDALPAHVTRELRELRHTWLRQHGIDPSNRDWRTRFAKLPAKEQRTYERLVGDRLNRKLDEGFGSCVLRRNQIGALVGAALEHFHGQRVWTGDFVVMPNHVHALMTPIKPVPLEAVLRSIKGFTSRRINDALGKSGPVWQRETYDHIVRDEKQLERFQDYIRNNPAKARLRDDEVVYSSAKYDVQVQRQRS